MKLIKCINDGGWPGIVVGQIYNVINEDEYYYYINEYNPYYRFRFIEIIDDVYSDIGKDFVQSLSTSQKVTLTQLMSADSLLLHQVLKCALK